jgi:hypothetical protein
MPARTARPRYAMVTMRASIHGKIATVLREVRPLPVKSSAVGWTWSAVISAARATAEVSAQRRH